MGLFKKLTDPSPGGGLTGDDPDGAPRVNDSRDHVTLPDRAAPQAAGARIVDPTELIMGGRRAEATIDAIRPAVKQINLQPTFEVTLTVLAESGDFSARVIQPVAEEYATVAEAGRSVRVKYDPDDLGAVWIDWAGSVGATQP
jgi:hypothetical protein